MALSKEKARYYGLKGGRPLGAMASHTLDVVEAKKLWIKKVHENLLPIFEALYNKAIQGDTMAIKELLIRSWGKSVQGVEVSGKDGQPIVFLPLALIEKHNLQVQEEIKPLQVESKVVEYSEKDTKKV